MSEKNPTFTKVPGYMPLRNEFDYEDEYTAEYFVMHIKPNKDDTAMET